MKTSQDLALLLALALAAAGCRSAHAEDRPDPRQPRYDPFSAVPSGSATAMPPEREPKVEDGHKPWAPTPGVVVPETPSDPPSKAEWASAPAAREVRITAPDCKAKRVREWYRIDCSAATWIELIGGTREGVDFGCIKFPDDDLGRCREVWIVFPARRGDRRAFQMFRMSKWGPGSDSIATEQFLEGDPYPQISVHGIRWGF